MVSVFIKKCELKANWTYRTASPSCFSQQEEVESQELVEFSSVAVSSEQEPGAHSLVEHSVCSAVAAWYFETSK